VTMALSVVLRTSRRLTSVPPELIVLTGSTCRVTIAVEVRREKPLLTV
jgi:hypothetical protein